MPEFDQINGGAIPQPQRQQELLRLDGTSRRDLLWVAAVAGIGAATAGWMSDVNRQEQAQNALAREQSARIEEFAVGVHGASEAALRMVEVMEFVNERIARQCAEGKGEVRYFGATVMKGNVLMHIGEVNVPVIIENPIVPMGTDPMVKDDPSSFWILYQDWRYPDGTPYFRPFWPGGRDVTMRFDDKSNPEQRVSLSLSSSEPDGRLDRVRMVDPATAEPIQGMMPIGLMRGIPLSAPTPVDLRYA